MNGSKNYQKVGGVILTDKSMIYIDFLTSFYIRLVVIYFVFIFILYSMVYTLKIFMPLLSLLKRIKSYDS